MSIQPSSHEEHLPDAAANGNGTAESHGQQIGRYTLQHQLGEGGCGVVYLAEQLSPVRRRVALKIIKPGMDTRSVIARFEAERQALALMEHPNIARVFDGGTTEEGRPYFVMELVRGPRITEYCDQRELDVRERLELFIQVCQAVQHAHQKGIIHRDIKPSNVLVTVAEGVPTPKVIDFGVAKAVEQRLTDKSFVTAVSGFVGTPAYMSPEQANMSNGDIDTRSDIYSLGILLYELLTGHTPFDSEGLAQFGVDAMRQAICEREPPRPSTRLRTLSAPELNSMARRCRTQAPRLIGALRGDLDWIVMTCLEKERTRRYSTVNGLSADIRRYLSNDPVAARPPSVLYRLRKLARRNRLVFGTGTFALAVLLAGFGVSIRLLVLESRAHRRALTAEREQAHLRQQAQDAARAMEEKLRDAHFARAQAGRRTGELGARVQSLAALQQAAALRPSLELRNEAIACLNVPDLRLVKLMPTSPASRRLVAIDSDAQRFASSGPVGGIQIRDLAQERELSYLAADPDRRVTAIHAFSPNGQFLPVQYSDGRLLVWDLDRPGTALWVEAEGSYGVDFSPDSRRLAVAISEKQQVLIYSPHANKVLRVLSTKIRPESVRWSPDGRHLAAVSSVTNVVEVLQLESGNSLALLEHASFVHDAVWHPDADLLLTACRGLATLSVWAPLRGRHVMDLIAPVANPVGLAFHPDGNWLALSSWDGTTSLWNFASGRQHVSIPATGTGLRFSRDGRSLSFVNPERGQLHVFEVLTRLGYRSLSAGARVNAASRVRQNYWAVDFDPTEQLVLAAGQSGLHFWDARRGTRLTSVELGNVHSGFFHPDGQHVISSGSAGCSRWRYEWDGMERRFKLNPAEPLAPTGSYGRARVTASGDVLAYLDDRRVHVRAASNSILLSDTPQLNRLALSPDGRWLAALPFQEPALGTIWELATGQVLRHFPSNLNMDIAFSPDGKWFVAGESEGFCFRDIRTGALERTLKRDRPAAFHGPLAFSPDGKWLALARSATAIQLLNYPACQEIATLESASGSTVTWLCISRSGNQLAVSAENETLELWDLRWLREQLSELKLEWPAAEAPPLPERAVDNL